MSDLLDACPKCGAQWSEVGEDGKTYYPNVGGNVVNDRIASWHCLVCSASWPRGCKEIEKP